jgi:hypothetical protein
MTVMDRLMNLVTCLAAVAAVALTIASGAPPVGAQDGPGARETEFSRDP